MPNPNLPANKRAASAKVLGGRRSTKRGKRK